MNYEKFNPHYHKPAKFTGEAYGTKISVEYDHSDLILDEMMDAFETIATGLGYHKDSWKQWILDRADEHREEEKENEKEFENLRHGYEDREKLEDEFFGKYEESDKRMDIIGQNGNEGLHYDIDMDEDYEGQFDEWDNETPIEEEIELNGHIWNDEDDIIVGASDEEGIDWDCTKYDGDGNLWQTDEDDYIATLEQDEDRYAATQEDEDEFEDANGGFERKPHFEWGDEPEEDEDLFDGDEWKPNQKLVEANERYKNEVKKMNIKKRNSK
jgi:hypothetical protein